MAQSIVNYAKQKGIPISSQIEKVEVSAGAGISGNVNGQAVAIGTRSFLENQGVIFELFEINMQVCQQEDDLIKQGKTILYASINHRLAALLIVDDKIRPSSVAALHALKKMGI